MSDGGVLRQLLASFVFEVDGKELDKGKEKVRNWMKDLRNLATAFAGGEIGATIKNFTKDTLEEITAIRRGAAELSITTEEFQGLRSAGRALGVDVKWLHFSIERLMVSTELAARGSRRQAEAMKLAGLVAKDTGGKTKSGTELFLELAGSLEKIQDPAKRAIVVWDLFGRGGHRLLPMLTVGRARLEELMMATKKYGQYTPEVIAKGAQLSITLETLNMAYIGLKNSIMKSWLPAIEKQAIGLRKVVMWLAEVTKKSLIGEAALKAFGLVMAAIAVKMAIAYPFAALMAGAFVVLTVALDELQVWWNEGHSIFDDIFGRKASMQMLDKVKSSWKEIAGFIHEAWEWYKKLLGIEEEEPFGPQTEEAYNASGGRRGFKFVETNPDSTRKEPGFREYAPPPGIKGQPLDLGEVPPWLHKLRQWAGTETANGAPATAVNIGNIVVNSPSNDPKAHGEAVKAVIQDHIRSAAASHARRARK